MENKIIKTHTTKDLLISSAIIIAGIGLFFANKALGIVIAMCGILSFLLYKSGYKCNGTGPLLTKKSIEIRRICRQSLIDLLNNKPVEPEIIEGNEGGTVLLEMWYNRNEKLVYAQLSDFQDFNFQQATDIVKLEPTNAEKLLNKIK